MRTLSLFLYRIFIGSYPLVARLLAYFSPKARAWVSGRRQWQQQLGQYAFSSAPIWMHCASLGEFEQGRPVLEALRERYPNVPILLSFFSPSGYEICKNTPLADYAMYLPMDSPSNAKQLLDIAKPRMVLFVKYEFWYFYLHETAKRQIPLYLISAVFHPTHIFFQGHGGFHRSMLSFFSAICVQDAQSATLLTRAYTGQVIITGDTRVDRVAQLPQQAKTFSDIEAFCKQAPIMIWGSTHPADEALLYELLQQEYAANWRFIVAPHETDEAHIQQIVQSSPLPIMRYSQMAATHQHDSRVLLIDSVGILSQLYQYADIAYIGGGFGAGIHNILEPFAFSVPVIFGPKYQKFSEAVAGIEQGAAQPIQDFETLEQVFLYWQSDEQRKAAAEAACLFISENIGATEKCIELMEAN